MVLNPSKAIMLFPTKKAPAVLVVDPDVDSAIRVGPVVDPLGVVT